MKTLLPFLLLLTACTPTSSSETYKMNLDDLQPPNQGAPNVLEVPSSVKAGEALIVRVSVAFGGCEEFLRFESKRSLDTLELTPLGERQLNVACTTIYGSKRVEFSDAAAPRSNPFKVIIHRGNGADLERSVTITP